MGCESAAKVVADIFAEAHVVGTTLGCAVASVVGPVVGVPISYEQCFVTVEQAADFTRKMINFWNAHIAKGGWATLGPRQLIPNTTIKGRIVSKGDRMLIMPYPFKTDSARLTITETDGRGRTSITVCKYNEGGIHTELAEWMVNDTDFRKDKPNEVRTLQLNGVKNYILVVKFDGLSLGYTLAYRLRLDV
jgi:hypothetical protein